MHVTLHITTGCTMRCDYCYAPPLTRRDMERSTALKAIGLAMEGSEKRAGIVFFGGEPLLRRDLIADTIGHCRMIEKDTGFSFHFKITTNGLLMDQEFIELACREGMQVSLSVDGIQAAHDRHRLLPDGKSAFAQIERNMEALLALQRGAIARMTVSPDTVPFYARSVEYLLAKGFRYLVISLDYGASWQESDLEELERQYQTLASLYRRLTLEERKFYLSPFEQKLASRINGERSQCRDCHLGYRQISVAFDGSLYPCIQFVGDGESKRQFMIGTVDEGIDEERRKALYRLSRESPDPCRECAIEERCEHRCGCVNHYSTGTVNGVSPLLCRTEQMLLPIADDLGEELYRLKAPMFLHKHYNPAWPVLSMLDDLCPA